MMSPTAPERDRKQRSIGCFGVSMMAHIGFFALMAAAPKPQTSDAGALEIGQSGSQVSIDMQTGKLPSATGLAHASEAQPALHEVLLADNNDPTGVAVPKESLQQKPVKKPVAKAETKPAPRPKAVAKQATPAKPTKVAVKATTKPAPPVETDDSSDVEIQKALVKAHDDGAKNENKQDKFEEVQAEDEAPAAPPVMVAQVTTEPPPRLTPAPRKESTPKKSSEPKKKKTDDDEDDEDDDIETVERVTPPVAPTVKVPAETPERAAITPTPKAATDATAAQAQQVRTAEQGLPSKQGPAAQPGSAQAIGGATAASAGAGRPGGPIGAAPGSALSNHVRDVSELIQVPGNPAPPYPQQDRLQGHQGTPVVVGQVQPNGSVSSVYLEKSSGSPTIDRAALQTFARWKFKPGQAGLARKAWIFQLTGNATEVPSQLHRIGQ